MAADRGSRISPTAHYTGQTWVHHGLSDPSLATPAGKLLHSGLRPLDLTLSLLGQPTLDGFLLARHRTIDAHLEDAIEDGSVSQVIELACGLSPRGLRFHRRYGDRITYIEADLPDMAALKRRRLRRAGSLDETHRVAVVDALADDGPESLERLTAGMDPDRGTALLTEGLVNYFDQDTAESMFARFARALGPFPTGVYLTDLYLSGDTDTPLIRVFSTALSLFVRGAVHTFHSSPDAAEGALIDAGFRSATVQLVADHAAAGSAGRDPGASLVRIARATT